MLEKHTTIAIVADETRCVNNNVDVMIHTNMNTCLNAIDYYDHRFNHSSHWHNLLSLSEVEWVDPL